VTFAHLPALTLPPGLEPRKHLGRTLGDLQPELLALEKSVGYTSLFFACVLLSPPVALLCVPPRLVRSHRPSPLRLNVCGEGGEYESFTLDCPMFHR
jgi:hypothetical protein